MIKLLLGGSPCTYWSVAQKNNREVEASGQGWELFKNYLLAKEKFQPDYFVYENNKSASPQIKEQICRELGTDLMYINSSLVSAQNRQRFYCFNWKVEQPADRKIVLKDILDKENKNNILLNYEYCDKPILLGKIGKGGQGERIYSVYGKSVTQIASGGGLGAKTGLYAIPIKYIEHISKDIKHYIDCDYEIKNGVVKLGDAYVDIKLEDGFYSIRKLSATEGCRLQTLPPDYCRAVSTNQARKALGNGWTAEVIIHILNGALKGVPKDEEIIVLSMYDGIGTGRYCLYKMGYTNVRYYAYEIDENAIKIAQSNYPDIIQCGDAFDLRKADWELPLN